MSLKLITKVEFPSFDFKIDYNKQLFFIGSCFTDNIGGQFEKYFFKTLINPFGVVYNPLSIAMILERILRKIFFTENELFEHNKLWHSFLHHSSFSGSDKYDVIKKINLSIGNAHDFLRNSDIMFVTLGTAFVYELTTSGEVVSNCHKLPASNFIRRKASVDEIVKTLSGVFEEIKKVNPKVRIILTISPVRHLKDGARGNNISKATLILSTAQLVDNYDYVSYFPAYEIIMDELRDYRFYAADMVHLSDIAVEYIWDKIKNVFLSKDTENALQIAVKLHKCLSHRPFNPKSAEYQQYVNKCLEFLESLEKTSNMQLSEIREKIVAFRQK